MLPGQPPTAGEPPPPSPSQRSYRDALLGGPTRHVPTRPLPPCSGCRWATEKKWSLWTASNRTRGRSQCSRRRRRGEVGRRGRPPHPPLPPADDSAEGGPVETAYFNRSLIMMCEYIVNKSANGLWGKNRGKVCREKIPQFVYSQLSFESCSIKSYSSYPVSQ